MQQSVAIQPDLEIVDALDHLDKIGCIAFEGVGRAEGAIANRIGNYALLLAGVVAGVLRISAVAE